MNLSCLEIPHILCKILSHFGKNDLLNSRLVCRFWNKTALKVLSKSNFRQKFEESYTICDLEDDDVPNRIQSYVNFAVQTGAKCVLPFELKIKLFGGGMCTPMGKICEGIKSLIKIFGPLSIVDLHICTFITNSKTLAQCTKLIVLLSTGLKSLTVKGDLEMTPSIPDAELQELGNSAFLNLKKLQWEFWPESVYSAIMKATPNLEELESNEFEMNNWPKYPEKLKILKIRHLNFDMTKLLKQIESRRPRSLKKLSIVSFGNFDRGFQIHAILDLFSLTLTYLKIGIEANISNSSFQFPSLPNLKHLVIKNVRNVCKPISVDTFKFGIIPESFPLLESIELSIGIFFAQVLTTFPNVISLRFVHDLNINYVDHTEFFNFESDFNFRQNISNCIRMFPNLSVFELFDDTEHCSNYKNQFEEIINLIRLK